jgi:hypothetical protein
VETHPPAPAPDDGAPARSGFGSASAPLAPPTPSLRVAPPFAAPGCDDGGKKLEDVTFAPFARAPSAPFAAGKCSFGRRIIAAVDARSPRARSPRAGPCNAAREERAIYFFLSSKKARRSVG